MDNLLPVGERVRLYISGQRGKVVGHTTYQAPEGVALGYVVELDKALIAEGLQVSLLVIHHDALRKAGQ